MTFFFHPGLILLDQKFLAYLEFFFVVKYLIIKAILFSPNCRYVSPKKLIFTSLLTCIGAAIGKKHAFKKLGQIHSKKTRSSITPITYLFFIVLCIFAGIESITENEKMSEIGLFIGTGLMGFGISTQFPR